MGRWNGCHVSVLCKQMKDGCKLERVIALKRSPCPPRPVGLMLALVPTQVIIMTTLHQGTIPHLVDGMVGLRETLRGQVSCMESHSQGSIGIKVLYLGSLTIIWPHGAALTHSPPGAKPLQHNYSSFVPAHLPTQPSFSDTLRKSVIDPPEGLKVIRKHGAEPCLLGSGPGSVDTDMWQVCAVQPPPVSLDPQGALTWVLHTLDTQARQGGRRGTMFFLPGYLGHSPRLLRPLPGRPMRLTLHFNITCVPTTHHPLTCPCRHTYLHSCAVTPTCTLTHTN